MLHKSEFFQTLFPYAICNITHRSIAESAQITNMCACVCTFIWIYKCHSSLLSFASVFYS